MKATYGAGQMKRFLRYELDRYLRGRAIERKKELPLITRGEQTAVFQVAARPTRAGIDPSSILIDRNPDDNLMAVEFAAVPVPVR